MSDDNDPFKYTQPREAAKGADVTKQALGEYRKIANQSVINQALNKRDENRKRQSTKSERDYNNALEQAKQFAAQTFGSGSTMKRGREKNVTDKDLAKKK